MTERENTASGRINTLPDQPSGTKVAARVLGNKSAPSSPRSGHHGGMHVKMPSVRDPSKVK
jgi:hypothetical protein